MILALNPAWGIAQGDNLELIGSISNALSLVAPQIDSDLCYVRITSNQNPTISDITPRFSIGNPAPRSIVITSPDPGETLPQGVHYPLAWNSKNAGPTVKIEGRLSGTARWIILATGVPNNEGANLRSVFIPNVNFDACWLRIQSEFAPWVEDESGPLSIG